MSGETNLGILLSTMDPELLEGEFVFCAVEAPVAENLYRSDAGRPWAVVREQESVTVIMDRRAADAAGLPYQTAMRLITLNVHSSLEAVGLTAAVSGRLASAGISANVVAAYYHDHVFVQSDKAEAALESLRRLVEENSASSTENGGRSMKAIKGASLGLHLLVGVGGLAGGYAAVSDPLSPLGIPVEMLEGSPFKDYLIPGIVLMAGIGMGNIAAALFAFLRFKYSGVSSGAMGAFLVGWIVIQCYILRTVAALHVIFFCIGAAQGLLALALLYSQGLFPFTLLKSLSKRPAKP